MIIKRQRNFSWEQGENGTWHYSPKGRELKFMYMKDPDLSDIPEEDSVEEEESDNDSEEIENEE